MAARGGRGDGRPVALIVTPKYLPLLGGLERECAILATEFARRGYHPVIVTEQLGLDTPRHELSDEAEVIRIPSSPRRTLWVQLAVAARMTGHLLRLRRRTAFGIVRTDTLPALVVGLLKALRILRFPTLVTAETSDDVAALARRPLFPVSRRLMSAHDVLNGIVSINVHNLRVNGFPEGKITLIPNGIDTAPWATTSPPERIRRFLFLGRIEPSKGVFELVEAFAAVSARHADAHLDVAGEGPSVEDLRSRAGELGIAAAVTFRGRVPYEELGDVFDSVDCLVLPSYAEGMPLSVLEAAAHHRSLILSDVGDLRSLFGGRTWVVPPRDVGALEAALEEAIADESPTTPYGAVIERVAIDRVADQMLRRLGVAPAVPS